MDLLYLGDGSIVVNWVGIAISIFILVLILVYAFTENKYIDRKLLSFYVLILIDIALFYTSIVLTPETVIAYGFLCVYAMAQISLMCFFRTRIQLKQAITKNEEALIAKYKKENRLFVKWYFIMLGFSFLSLYKYYIIFSR